MTRTVSSPTLAAIGAGVSRPAYLVQIDWLTTTSRLCSYGDVSWSGNVWVGADVRLTFDATGVPTGMTIFDPDAAFRTLILGSGVNDRRIRVWGCDVAALGNSDPVLLGDGFGNGADFDGGRCKIGIELATTRAQFTPRERIGPRVGINFVGTPGQIVQWNNWTLTLEEGNG